jgi:RNA polymerase sigma-70 factor (ECF subfamily)
MADGPDAGLVLVDALEDRLGGYQYLHATRADLLRRLGRLAEARTSYQQALARVETVADRRFLQGRLEQLAAGKR